MTKHISSCTTLVQCMLRLLSLNADEDIRAPPQKFSDVMQLYNQLAPDPGWGGKAKNPSLFLLYLLGNSHINTGSGKNE